MAPCPGLPGWAGTRKVKPIWILLEQETVSGSGISWAICKSAHRSRQITTPTPHHSAFLQAGCPSCRPTNSVKALKALLITQHTEHTLSTLNIHSMQHYKCRARCKDISLQRGWFHARSLASCVPRSSEDRWPVFATITSKVSQQQMSRKVHNSGCYYSRKWQSGKNISWTICISFARHST